MERIGIRELNQQTSRVIERVRNGEALEVTDRGRVVARLVPAPEFPEPLAQLVAEGRATPATAWGPIPVPPDDGTSDVDIAAALAAEREEGRW